MKRSEAPERAQRTLKDYDILFQCVRPYQQNNLLYRKLANEESVASTGYAQIRTHHNPSYLYYLLNTEQFKTEVMVRCTGTSYPAISSNDLGEIPITICNKEEQQKIASVLRAIEKKVVLEKKLLKLYQVQKKDFLHSLLV